MKIKDECLVQTIKNYVITTAHNGISTMQKHNVKSTTHNDKCTGENKETSLQAVEVFHIKTHGILLAVCLCKIILIRRWFDV